MKGLRLWVCIGSIVAALALTGCYYKKESVHKGGGNRDVGWNDRGGHDRDWNHDRDRNHDHDGRDRDKRDDRGGRNGGGQHRLMEDTGTAPGGEAMPAQS